MPYDYEMDEPSSDFYDRPERKKPIERPTSDSVSFRLNYFVPELVKTKNGMLASGYKIVRIPRRHVCDVYDYKTHSSEIMQSDRERLEKKLTREAAGWPIKFLGASVMSHPYDENPDVNDASWDDPREADGLRPKKDSITQRQR